MRTMALAIAAALLALGCDGSGPGANGSGGNGGGNGGTFVTTSVAATLTLRPGGVVPDDVTVGTGANVLFVNADLLDHQVASAACAELAGIELAPGEQRTVTMANHAESCGFTDRLHPDAAAFSGTIRVIVDGAGSIGF